jgi:hypothetical protein
MAAKDPEPNLVARYTRVEIDLTDPSGECERIAFTIVPDDQADFYSGLLGESTPLAAAILGKSAGMLASYYANGMQRVKILNVAPINGAGAGEAAARRKAAVQEALTQAERTSALIYATSVDSKWGDYDADGMIEGWDEGQKTEPETAESANDTNKDDDNSK